MMVYKNKIFFIFLLTILSYFSVYSKIEIENISLDSWSEKKETINDENIKNIFSKEIENSVELLTKDDNSWPLLDKNQKEEFKNKIENLKNEEIIIGYPQKIIPKIPYTQKLILKDNSTINLIGDIHGNFDDFYKILNDLHKKELIKSDFTLNENIYFITLGDYTDRNDKGLEVLLTLMLLKIKNPNQVFLIKGNHESFYINKKYDFNEEIYNKIKNKTFYNNIINLVNNSYELMPAAIYVGNSNQSKFVHLSHGGIEIRYNPENLIKSEIKENENIQFDYLKDKNELPFLEGLKQEFDIIKEYCEKVTNPIYGFLWNYFLYDGTENIHQNFFSKFFSTEKVMKKPGTIFKMTYNYKFVKNFFEKCNLQNMFERFICGHNHIIPKKLEFGEEIEESKLKKFSSGCSPINKNIITLISTSIPPINYYPTYLQIKLINNKFEFNTVCLKPKTN